MHYNHLKTRKTERQRRSRPSLGAPSVAFQHGFTLIELVMVLVVTAVLAAMAAPSFNSLSGFNARGFHDQTLAYLRFAQKTAVAQRRTVCVSFTGTSLSLGIASSAGASNCSAAGALTGPQGETPATLNAKSGVSYSTTPTSFNFDSLGQPITSSGSVQTTQTWQVSGVGSSITVETGTGYVHE